LIIALETEILKEEQSKKAKLLLEKNMQVLNGLINYYERSDLR